MFQPILMRFLCTHAGEKICSHVILNGVADGVKDLGRTNGWKQQVLR